MATVFVVDDDELVVKSLLRVLRKPGRELRAFPSAAAALGRLEERPDLLICDYRLQSLNGVELCQRAKKTVAGIKTLVLSGASGELAIEAAIRAGDIDGFVAKPWRNDDLAEMVERLLGS